MRTAVPKLDRDQLIDWFHARGTPRKDWLVGAEFERHLLRPDGTPLPYYGEHGVRWLLEALQDHGWELKLEGANPIAAIHGQTSVTLEPGAQFELSGAPFDNVQELADEATAFTTLVAELLEGTDTRQVAIGFTPYAEIEAIPWVPKGRYVVMEEYLGRTGKLAHHMMKGTCAVQASYDFLDEEDCARKVALATRLGPMTTALFANSPYASGRAVGWVSYRGHIWTRTDPRRTGMPDAAEHYSFARWVDYLLDAPMMFYNLDDRWLPAKGRPFRDWMENGLEGRFPTWKDWDLHLTSVFPEVRVKHAIEVRGADCVPRPLALAFVALFKGLFYCRKALGEAEAFAERFTESGTKEERFAVACRDGLRGEIGGRRLAAWADELLEITWHALERCAPEDRPWLAPLEALVRSGDSPGHVLLDTLGDAPEPSALVATCAL